MTLYSEPNLMGDAQVFEEGSYSTVGSFMNDAASSALVVEPVRVYVDELPGDRLTTSQASLPGFDNRESLHRRAVKPVRRAPAAVLPGRGCRRGIWR